MTAVTPKVTPSTYCSYCAIMGEIFSLRLENHVLQVQGLQYENILDNFLLIKSSESVGSNVINFDD